MEKQQGKTPQIRFPEFKNQWEHRKLSDLLSESKLKNTDLKYDKDEVLSVSGELGIVNQIEHLGRSYAGESVHNYGVVETGDIVYTKSPLKANPFGIIKLNKGKAGIVSTLYAVYKVNHKNAFGAFIDYYFSLDANTNRYLRPLVRKGAKNTLQITNEEAINSEIFVPTIDEQKRIASFLTVLDKKIAQLKQKKTLLEQYKKGVMQKLFSQELRFKDENGNEFPKWEKKKLGEIAEFTSSKRVYLSDYVNEGIPFYRGKEISELKNNVEPKDVLYITNDVYNTFKKEFGVPQVNDILITAVGTLGNVLKIRSNKPFYFKDGNLIWLRKIAENSDFLEILLEFKNRDIERSSIGSTQKALTMVELRKLVFDFPCLVEQTKIANFLTAIDEKINRTENQIQQTQEYKKGLLQNMFC